MRLLGRHDDLASTRGAAASSPVPGSQEAAESDAAVARRACAFGSYQGLALWMDLTADWHAGDKAHLWDA